MNRFNLHFEQYSIMFEKRLLSIKDLMAEYDVMDWFWRTQIWGKNLPYIRVGRKMFIDQRDVDSCFKENKTAG